MATVVSKTSIKIDDLINDTVVSGAVIDGQLILVTRGGAEINAGSVSKTFGLEWSKSTPYVVGDLVGYAGGFFKATADNVNYPPYFYSNSWVQIVGVDASDWVSKDTFFEAQTLTYWDFFWKNGTASAALTSTVGEFESGHQALKITLGTNSTQRIYNRTENIIKGVGDTVTVTVRAKYLAAGSTTVPTLTTSLNQNDQLHSPEPLAAGASFTGPLEGTAALTTTFSTYTFTMNAVDAKPRAQINLIVSTGAAGTGVVVIDSVVYARNAGAVKSAGLVAANGTGVPAASTVWARYNNWIQDTTFPSNMVVTPNGIQVTEAGYYNVTFQGIWTANATGTRAIYVDIAPTETEAYNATRPYLQQYSSAAEVVSLLSGSIYVPAGYWIRAWAYQASGVTLNFGVNAMVTFFRAVKAASILPGNTGGGGSGPAPGPPVTYTQSFASPTTTWLCSHNLGDKFVEVVCYDLSGNVIEGDIVYNDLNNCTVSWYNPVAGSVNIQQ